VTVLKIQQNKQKLNLTKLIRILNRLFSDVPFIMQTTFYFIIGLLL